MKVPFLPAEEIWDAADSFRDKYSDGLCPVDILKIAEFDLNITIFPQPELRNMTEVEAFITSDFNIIYVDKAQHDHRSSNRLKFSVAHEIGHLVLHKSFYDKQGITNIESMMKFLDSLPEGQYSFLETHAYEFAGRLLVDPGVLTGEVDKAIARGKAANFKVNEQNLSAVLRFIAEPISEVFQVSPGVIEKRIEKERLIPVIIKSLS